MHTKFAIVLVVVLFILSTQTAEAHTGVEIPFTLEIQKNMSLRWFANTSVDLEGGNASFSYLQGGGFCNKYEVALAQYIVALFLNGKVVKTVTGLGSQDGDINPIYHDLGNVLANEAIFIDPSAYSFGGGSSLDFGAIIGGFFGNIGSALGISGIFDNDKRTSNLCPGVGFNEITNPGDPYMAGMIEAIQTASTVQKHASINTEPEQLGLLSGLAPGFKLRTPDTKVIDETALVHSLNPNILVWFGTPEKVGPTTTKDITKDIYGCTDLDNSKECDSVEAELAHCEISTAGVCDWYKGSRCDDKASANLCQYINNINAVCGKTPDTTAKFQFAVPEEVGQIHDFTGCAPKMQVVFDEYRTMHKCDASSTEKFITIKGHQYYCDATKPEITECGIDDIKKYSKTNSLTAGQNILIQGKTNYCLENGQFSTNLDYTTKKSCENAGQNWTGTRCCSEADDKTGTTTGNEYYSDTPTQDTTKVGGCWNSTFVPRGNYAPNYTNNSQNDTSIINHNGTFYGCLLTNPTLLALQNTDQHVPATNTILAPALEIQNTQTYVYCHTEGENYRDCVIAPPQSAGYIVKPTTGGGYNWEGYDWVDSGLNKESIGGIATDANIIPNGFVKKAMTRYCYTEGGNYRDCVIVPEDISPPKSLFPLDGPFPAQGRGSGTLFSALIGDSAVVQSGVYHSSAGDYFAREMRIYCYTEGGNYRDCVIVQKGTPKGSDTPKPTGPLPLGALSVPGNYDWEDVGSAGYYMLYTQ